MLGVIVNCILIIVGSLIGSLFKKASKYEVPIKRVLGLSTMFIGINSVVKAMGNKDVSVILFLVSLVLGAFIGEIIKVDKGFENIGNFISKLVTKKSSEEESTEDIIEKDIILNSGESKKGKFSYAFATASILYITGSMAILGPLQGGLSHDYSMLFTKGILDGTFAIIMVGSLGIGVGFSIFPVFVYEGAIALLAGLITPFITTASMDGVSAVGGAIVTAIGLDMLGVRINYANLSPAMFLPIIYFLPVVQKLIHIFIK
ncbi:MAG: DUF554 domain-containing protein [Lachnospiraceae bacterium]|jgi:uncharacterized membrane protein YqgA involved in biofilm formation|nr:DUF554 domain-containing protein [Lachnospiraceae bacterium]